MAKQEFRMPQMGESIIEATILGWSKSVGDHVEEDETLLEIATDKVDSELPSPFSGKLLSINYKEGDVVSVGAVIAVIETEGEEIVTSTPSAAQPDQPKVSVTTQPTPAITKTDAVQTKATTSIAELVAPAITTAQGENLAELQIRPSQTNRFYSPLVRAIAEMEQLSIGELDHIRGTGADGRVTKTDVVSYVQRREAIVDKRSINYTKASTTKPSSAASYGGDVEIVEMDRMRRMIADHMVMSKQTSPHVTSFLEVDVTPIVDWRSAHKDAYLAKHGEKITYTPIFIHAVANAIKDFPGINASVDGHSIILKKSINIGMATATASGNLIVPVLKHVDHMDIHAVVHTVNDLAHRAREGKLKPDEAQGGTFTLTNVGTFGNTMGTPIINQPQVAIMSTGAIRKKPAVVETEQGDKIEVRRFMFLSLSYDHRIVDGALGGQFLRRVGDYLEQFDASMLN